MATVRRRAGTSLNENNTADGEIELHKDEKPADASSAQNSKATVGAVAATVLSPTLLVTFVLIFGGCCSNVYTLESILKLSPATGSLITCLQFVLTTLFKLPSQLTTKEDPDSRSADASSSLFPRLRVRHVPLYKWVIYTSLFLLINILNNSAFEYRISVPLHIILRSAGPVTSMMVGYLFAGRRYDARKIVAVLLLFAGVVLAALSDAASRGKVAVTDASAQSELSKQIPGFVLLFSALLLSAFMGIYSDDLYRTHGRSNAITDESLFYSHFLSLPFFAAQFRGLYSQYSVMVLSASATSNAASVASPALKLPGVFNPLANYMPEKLLREVNSMTPFFLLLANALTQIVCITGVNRLSIQTTSLTVSIVLNIRKLISLLLSIWLFGNKLPSGVAAGATVVFLGVALYGWPSSKTQPKRGADKKSR